MAARLSLGNKSHAARLKHLSVPFAVELRLKIVSELYMREMSAKQFQAEFGGGSIMRVTQNFKTLAKHGWLRHVRTETGGERRGAKEHFYRATEPIYFDAETWALLPYSVQVAFSWSSFKQIAELVREEIEGWHAEDFSSDPSLTCSSIIVDQCGWKRVIDAIDTQFVCLYEEQVDAGRRMSLSGEAPMRTSVLQIAFESSDEGRSQPYPSLIEDCYERPVPFPVRLSKIFADEVLLHIVAEANRREVSASQFRSDLLTPRAISRRFRLLEQIGWLKQVATKSGGKRRGAAEKFYRATGPAIHDDQDPWASIPDSLSAVASWRSFEGLSERIKQSMKAGTFDARADRYLAWSVLRLDRQGWEKVSAKICALREFILQEQDRASSRMADSGESPMSMTIGLGAFASTTATRREP